MANREAVFNLRVNTGNSVKDIQNLDQNINRLNKDMQETQMTASQGSGTDEFSKKLDDLDKKLASGTLTFKEMSKAMKSYQGIAQQAGLETPVGQRAIDSVVELRENLNRIKAETKLLTSEYVALDTAVAGIETGAAVFEGFQSVIALTGEESEDLVKTMVKLQAAHGFINSIQSISNKLKERDVFLTGLQSIAQKAYALAVGQSTGAMKIFRLALISTGIGALIVGIGLLIANFEKVVGWINKSIKSFRESSIAVKILLGPIMLLIAAYDGVKWVLQQLGVVDSEETKARIKNAEDRVTALEKEKKMIEDRYDFEIAKARAAGKETYDLEQEKRKAVRESVLDQIRQITKLAALNREVTQEQRDKINELKEEYIKSAKETTIAEITENKRKEDEAKKKAEQGKKRIDDEYKAEQERLKNLQALRNEFLAELEAAETEYFDSLLTDQQREERAVNDKFFNLIEQARQYGEDTSVLEEAQAKSLADIRKKFDDERLAKLRETEEHKLELLRSFQEIVLDEYQNDLIAFEDAQKEKSKALSEALKEGVITEAQFMEAQLKLEEAYAQKEIELNKAKNEAIKEANAKRWEEETKNIQKALEFAQMGLDQLGAINDLLNQIGENRLNTIAEQQDAELASLDAKQQAALSNESLTAEQRTKIEQDFAQQKYQVQLKAFNEEEKIKKAQFARDKALRIAQASIDTASAVIKSIAQGGGIPTGLPFGIAAAALGATQIATIAAQKYQGGTAPSPPSLSGGVTGAGASSFQASSDNLNTEQTDLSTIGQQAPVSQVVVLESDITGTQNKVAMQEKLSTY